MEAVGVPVGGAGAKEAAAAAAAADFTGTDEQTAAALKIQSIQRGKAARADVARRRGGAPEAEHARAMEALGGVAEGDEQEWEPAEVEVEVTLPPVAMPSPPDVAIPRGADSTVGPGGVVGGMSALDMGIGMNPGAGTGLDLDYGRAWRILPTTSQDSMLSWNEGSHCVD